MFYNELDLLEMRLAHLADAVHRFVLVEGDRTFAGHPKMLYFQENKHRFEPYLHKIDHLVVNDFPVTRNSWIREFWQRNRMAEGYAKAHDDDLILISDVDEIPDIATILSNEVEGHVHALNQRFYYYYLNLRKGYSAAATATRKKYLHCTPQETRQLRDRPIIQDAGWHFSYLGDAVWIQNKIASFAHQEFNNENYNTPQNIEEALTVKRDLFRRSGELVVEEIDNSYPKVLRDNLDKYEAYIAKKD